MSLMISGLYISLTALFAIVLAYRVVRLRRINKVGIGNGKNPELSLAARVHANFIENAPFAMALLLVSEANGMPAILLHAFGTAWLVARMLHAIGLTQGQGGYHFGRFWGVLLTWTVLLGLAVANIGFFLGL
ncbi:MAPEG family protein [Shewanella sp. SR44-3]|uniref:MAPEG family protein n=1 Tax=unclassified Shewanella TaxID=196818 RepID=UPI0015FD47E6|nr:MAPEG family protein [Shewanella sp. SR44-3]MBB1270471.1 MAPEG family protein [Shewanella sp. SR44-3]